MVECYTPRERPVLPAVPLLVTESRGEFDRIREALDQEINPRGIVEKMFIADVAYLYWDIARLRRCQAAIISSEVRQALASLLDRLLREPGDPQDGNWLCSVSPEAENLAEQWFSDKAAKKRVLELLGRFQLDSSVIEAEAVRRCAADLERINRMLAAAESRRDRALRHIFEYRQVFARQLRDSGNRIIEGEALGVEDGAGKSQSAQA